MRKKIINVPISEELLQSVDTHARQVGRSRAAFVREACADYIRRTEEEEKFLLDEQERERQYIESYTKFPETHEPEDWSDWDPPSS